MIGLDLQPDPENEPMQGMGARYWRGTAASAARAVRKALILLESTAKAYVSRPGKGRVYGLEQAVSFVARAASKGGAVFSGKGRNVSVVSFTANAGVRATKDKKTGRVIFKRGRKRARVHQASLPGDPPAIDTGSFRNSITHTPPEITGDEVSGEWGSNDVRSRIFEFGGLTGRGHRTRILPRPWIRPTEDIAARRVEELLNDEV